MPFITRSFPLVGNLVGLAHGAAKGLGSVAGASYIEDYCGLISFATGPFVVDGGSILLYAVTAAELDRFNDGVDPNTTLDQSRSIATATQANLIQRLGFDNPLLPNTSYAFGGFGIKAVLGTTPTLWAPLIWNLSGGSLSVMITPYAVHTLQT